MTKELILRAFQGLYPDREFPYQARLRYSGRFKGFNGNVRLDGKDLVVSLSKKWKGISDDIQIGIIQELLIKILHKRGRNRLDKEELTPEMNLYHSFMRNVHLAVPKEKHDDTLAASFDRINEGFFAGMMRTPNLEWMDGTRTMGTYDFGTDTIRISRILAEDLELMDYVMYHEMLHKKHKFSSGFGRSLYHSKEFREDERKFPNAQQLENRLMRLSSKTRRRPSPSDKRRSKGLRKWLPW